tara:strand:+ start:418 stop:621 length:204 start_codon:yes stop_codon:yes gene_type:complete
MKRYDGRNLDLDDATQYLLKNGYLVVENLLGKDELAQLSRDIDKIFIDEREDPFDPVTVRATPMMML